MWWNKLTSVVTILVVGFAVAALFSDNPHAFLNGILIGIMIVLGLEIPIVLKNPVLYEQVIQVFQGNPTPT